MRNSFASFAAGEHAQLAHALQMIADTYPTPRGRRLRVHVEPMISGFRNVALVTVSRVVSRVGLHEVVEASESREVDLEDGVLVQGWARWVADRFRAEVRYLCRLVSLSPSPTFRIGTKGTRRLRVRREPP